MLTLVTGGAACGKSEYAESLFGGVQGKIYYAATMHRSPDRETTERIRRHQKMREGRNFITLEQETDIGSLLVEKEDGILVECMSNLLANEMYAAKRENAVSFILEGVDRLREKCNNIVLVTLETGMDGIVYDAFTNGYIANMGRLNAELASRADKVVEVVYSIPVLIKRCENENLEFV